MTHLYRVEDTFYLCTEQGHQKFEFPMTHTEVLDLILNASDQYIDYLKEKEGITEPIPLKLKIKHYKNNKPLEELEI